MGKKGKCRIVRTRSLTVVCSGECAEVSRARLCCSVGRAVGRFSMFSGIR